MQSPSAAGFLPNKSVIDELSTLFNTFGKDARLQREAQRKLMGAQTGNLESETAFRPDVSARDWAGQDLQRQGLDFSREKLASDESRDWANYGVNADEVAVRKQALQQNQTQHSDEALLKLLNEISMSPNVDPSVRDSVLVSVLEKFAPQAAAALKAQTEQTNQIRQSVLDRTGAGKEKSSSGGGILSELSGINDLKRVGSALKNPASGMLKGVGESIANAPGEGLIDKAFQFFAPSMGRKSAPAQGSSTEKQTPLSLGSTPSSNPNDILRGPTTIFGHNLDGSPDTQDNGIGAFGANTRDPNVEGVSLPFETLDQFFGSHRNANAIKNAKVWVQNPKTGQTGTFPILDKGPAKWTGNALDLTGAAGRKLGSTGKDEMLFRILNSLPQ